MNEFIEKLIGRLEEERATSWNAGYKNGLEKSIKIVNQLAAEYAPKTNADKICSMSDEELAEFLVNFKNTFGEEYEGKMSCLDWLQSQTE